MSLAELRGLAVKLMPSVGSEGYAILVGGYDDDPRELYQIPEVIDLFKRVIKSGLLSVLEVSTSIGKDFAGALGALEIWAAVALTPDTPITPEIMQSFHHDLMISNSVLQASMQEFNDQSLVDGQHKLN